jgi:hypothetical protein
LNFGKATMAQFLGELSETKSTFVI